MTKRVLIFLSPYFLALVAFSALAIKSGEFFPANMMGYLSSLGHPFLYLPAYSDRNFQYKKSAAIHSHADIIAIGSSRMNQWRSAMFRPYHFYNAAGALYVQEDYRRFIEALGNDTPKVVLFSIDSFTFDPNIDPIFKHRDYGNSIEFSASSYATTFKKVVDGFYEEPSLIFNFRESIHQTPALGLYALATASGFRIDGSYQYGSFIQNKAPTREQSRADFLKRVNEGTFPFLKRSDAAVRKLEEFQKFVVYAKRKNILLIGISMPMEDAVTTALKNSPDHGLWRKFNSSEMAEWFRSQGVLYFNFSDIKTFGGNDDEFIDPVHPSEPAYIRMLLAMMKEPKFKALFGKISEKQLKEHLETKTGFEAYRNEF